MMVLRIEHATDSGISWLHESSDEKLGGSKLYSLRLRLFWADLVRIFPHIAVLDIVFFSKLYGVSYVVLLIGAPAKNLCLVENNTKPEVGEKRRGQPHTTVTTQN